MGGAVALNLALERPDRVTALVLADAAVHGYRDWSDEMRAFGDAEDAALARGDLEAAVALNVRMWVDRPGRRGVRPELCNLVARMQRRAFERQLACPEADEQTLEPMAFDRLEEVDASALVLCGAEDAPDFLTLTDRLRTQLPRARPATIPGAAHLPSLERSGAFNAALTAFLDAL
jgi:pimeloyl-ACP methyl ester carboxylesterase